MMKRTKAGLRAILAGSVMVLVIVACTRVPLDWQAFQRARRVGSARAYERFTRIYPTSPLAADARNQAAQLREEEALNLFEGVKTATKASLLERFIARHPNTKAVTLAKLRIAEIDFHDLATQNPFRAFRPSNSSWGGFVNSYAFGDYLPVPKDAKLRDTYYKKIHPRVVYALAQESSFQAWAGYLTTYPDSPYFDRAARQLEDFLVAQSNKWEGYEMLKSYLALYDGKRIKRSCPRRDALIHKFHEGLADAAEQEDTRAEYQRYLDTFPDSPYQERVTLRKAHLEFREELLGDDRDKLEELIAKYPGAKGDIAKARRRVEQIDFKSAVQEGTPQAYHQFRKRYEKSDPAGLLKEVTRRLDYLRKRMLARVKREHRSRSYRTFLANFPNAPQRNEVLRLLEETEFGEAIKGTDRAQIEKLLRRHPASPFGERARTRIDELDFEQARVEAINEPSTAPLRRYLDEHSKGNFVSDAQTLITQVNRHYADYIAQLRRARESSDALRFNAWLADNPGNYYAMRRGRDDLGVLRRELVIERIVADLTTTPTRRSRRAIPARLARALKEHSRAIAYVETNTGSSTGFIFTGGGLLLTNARMVRNADPRRISAKLVGQRYPCNLASMADRKGPDVTVLRVEGMFNSIPLGNSAVLASGEKVTCLSARDPGIVPSEGTFVETRHANGKEWLIIQSSEIRVKLGGVVLNRRAQAVGLLVRPEQVDSAVRDDAPDRRYALSLRSALPVMKKALSGK